MHDFALHELVEDEEDGQGANGHARKKADDEELGFRVPSQSELRLSGSGRPREGQKMPPPSLKPAER